MRVTLFTFNHDDVTTALLDWVCERCGHLSVYSGMSHAIFAAEYDIACTVELMYWWVHEICLGTKSLCTVYASTRKLQLSGSFKRRFTTGRLKKLGGSRMQNRQNASSAIRMFIQLMHLDSDIAI